MCLHVVVYYRSAELQSKIFACVSAKIFVYLIAGSRKCKRVSITYFYVFRVRTFLCMYGSLFAF